MDKRKVRRCGNCAWAKRRDPEHSFMTLTCNNQVSCYYRKGRNTGYFACRLHHFPIGYLGDLSK